MTQTKPSPFDFKIAQNAIFKTLESNYHYFISDIRADLKDGFTSEFVDLQFLEQLFDIIHDEDLNTFSWANFHWSLKLNDLIYIIQLHEEILAQEEFNESNDNFSEVEEELFTFWNESSYYEVFKKNLDDGLSLIDVSDSLIPLIENEIISFYVLHINKYRQEFSDPIVYMANEEFGDNQTEIYLPFKSQKIIFKKPINSFPTIVLYEYLPEKNTVLIENEEQGLIHSLNLKSKNHSSNSFLSFLSFFEGFLPNITRTTEESIANFMIVFNLILSNYSAIEKSNTEYSNLVESFLKSYNTENFDFKDTNSIFLNLKKDNNLDKNIKNFLTAIIRTRN